MKPELQDHSPHPQILIGLSDSFVEVAVRGTPFKQDENPREKGPITDTTSALLMALDARLCSVWTGMISPGLMSIATITNTAHTILRKSGCDRPIVCASDVSST